MNRDKMEARLDVLIADMAEIKDAIAGGSYPNWYPETLKQRQSEYRALIYALHNS